MLQQSSSYPRSLRLLGILFLLLVLPFLAISWYAYPSMDDYGFADRLRTQGFIGAQITWYVTLQGRYFSTALIYASSYLMQAGVYWLIPVALILAMFFAFRTLFRSLGGGECGGTRPSACALAVLAIYLCQMPQPVTGLYWSTGACSYLIPGVLLVLLLSALTRATGTEGGKNRTWLMGVSCLLIFAIIGCSEPHMIATLAVVGLGSAVAVATRHPSRWRWLCLLIVALLCAAIVIGAPGNRARLSLCDDTYRRFPLRGALAAIRFSKIAFLSWAFDATILSASILFVPLAFHASGRIRALRERPRWLLALPLAWLATFAAMAFACFYGTGSAPPPRVINGLYLFFLLGWFMTAAIAVACFVKPRLEGHGIPDYLLYAAGGILAANLVFQTNYTPVLRDLVLRAPAYKRQVRERETLIRTALANHVENLVVPGFENPPATLCFGGIVPNPASWQNVDFAAFWGLKSIATPPEHDGSSDRGRPAAAGGD